MWFLSAFFLLCLLFCLYMFALEVFGFVPKAAARFHISVGMQFFSQTKHLESLIFRIVRTGDKPVPSPLFYNGSMRKIGVKSFILILVYPLLHRMVYTPLSRSEREKESEYDSDSSHIPVFLRCFDYNFAISLSYIFAISLFKNEK